VTSTAKIIEIGALAARTWHCDDEAELTVIMNTELAYRCALLSEDRLNNRTKAYAALVKAGWARKILDRDLDAALAWAKSHRIAAHQEKARRQRAAEKMRIRGDDALDEMFRAAGADPADIPRRGVR
jgi:hypothetical protein